MDVVMGWLKTGLKWVSIAFGLLVLAVVLMVWTSDPVKPKEPTRHSPENLFKPGTIMHLVSDQLSLIAPGQLIYIVHREEGRPAFPGELKDPNRKDLEHFLSSRYEFNDNQKGFYINAYVQEAVSVKNNTCLINLNPANITHTAKKFGSIETDQLILTLAHEATHCGQLAETFKMKERMNTAILKAKNELGLPGEKDAVYKKARVVFAEGFVGAYFLANAKSPGQSPLLDTIAHAGWMDELKQSERRGYANIFAAIIKRCEKATACPRDLKALNAELINDPAIMRAVVLDAVAIVKKTPNFAQTK